MVDNIKFGTDGWRAIIADTYTLENVVRVATATAKRVLQRDSKNPICVVGYDTRFGGEMFAKKAAWVIASHGIKVYLSNNFCTTPMLSLATYKLNATLGVIITASHNPPSYNGFKIKDNFGGPALPEEIKKVEALIPDYYEIPQGGKLDIDSFDADKIYMDAINTNFNLSLLQKQGISLAYDAMYGAGQGIINEVFPIITKLHCELNPSFMGQAPEPIHKNLGELSELVKNNAKLKFGLANDGDADRIGFYDEDGNFVDSHHLILLLMKYLVEEKKMSGKIVKSFSVSNKVDVLAKYLGLETITTKIGFKYICGHMVEDDVLIGAEESGGIAVKGHIPERDGIWTALLLLEYCEKTGKSIKQLVQDVYEITGSFAVERYDLHLDNDIKNSIMDKCKSGKYTEFGTLKVVKTESVDGYKFFFENGTWVMIRPSGTEPLLRVYAEAKNKDACFAILDEVKGHILNQ